MQLERMHVIEFSIKGAIFAKNFVENERKKLFVMLQQSSDPKKNAWLLSP